MHRVGLVIKRGEAQALALGQKIVEFLNESGRTVLLEKIFADGSQNWSVQFSDRIADDADLLVVLGGDGTMLRAAALLNDKSTPVLGINLGRVGFMADIPPHEAFRELQATLDGSALFVERMLLEVSVPHCKTAKVLNDVVIHWGGIARLIDIGVRIGQAKEIELRADGLIVSTPTGSSAYSFAANGPLMHPDIQGVILTPICPYAGLKRPLIVPPDFTIDLVLIKGERFNLTLDGHTTIDLGQGASIRIRKAPLPFVMVQRRGHNYIDLLREKLKLE